MSEPGKSEQHGPEDRFQLYALLFSKLNQEGDGIWSRFNILLGLNLALFAGFAFVFGAEKPHPLWRQFAIGISVLGVAASVWSYLVLKRLWAWHRLWKHQLREIETQFPTGDGWVKPHTEMPKGLPLRRGAPGSTQPFFVALMVVWGVLLGVAIVYGK